MNTSSITLLVLLGSPDVHVHDHEHEHSHGETVHSHAHEHPAADIQHHHHAHEDDEAPPPDWKVGAFVDLSYAVNSNFPENHVWRGQARNARSNELALNLVAAYLMHEPRRAAPFRLEIALQAGSDVESTWGAEPNGAFIGPEAFKHVGLANAGVVAPWGWDRGHRTETGVGVFASPITVGGFWSKDNWNYSPSWGNSGTPFYVMGAHVKQHLADKVALQAWVVNGWQIVGDNNQVPSGMFTLSAEPVDDLTLASTVYFGPDHADISPEAWRVHSDTQLVYEKDAGGVGFYVDYGQEKRTDLLGEPIHRWATGAILTRWRVREFPRARWDMGLRPEFWWDQSGAIFGESQWLLSFSYTNTARLFDHVVARIEYRYDRSSLANGYFYQDDATNDTDVLARDQHTVFFSLVGYYELGFSGKRRTKKD